MPVHRWRAVLLGCLLWCAWTGLSAQALSEPMSPPRLVNDFAGILSAPQRTALESRLETFDRESSTQIAVVSVTDLQGYTPADFAQRLHEQWGVGRKGLDNGVLLLVKPKEASSRGEVFISVGYGLEGVIPDITAGRIIDNEMLPHLREGDYYGAIDAAVTVLIQLAQGEFTARQYDDRSQRDTWAALLFMVLLIVVILITVRGIWKNGGGGGPGGSGGGWIPPVIIGRGFGGGFSGGGGFGGFGGGSSGGGGAGRSW